EPLQGDAGDDFALAVHFRDAPALIRSEFDAGYVLEQHRQAAIILDHDLLKVGQALDIATSAHRKFGLCKLDRAPAHVHVAGAQGFTDFGERDAKGLQPARVNHDAVLLDETANARNLRDAFRLGDAVANIPILNGAQFGQAPLRAADDVLVDPSDARRVGAEAWRDTGRQPARGGTEIFEDARARPVEIGPVFKNDVDERYPEEREAAHHPRFRNAQHRGGERIRDLILDHLRGLAGIFRIDDHLH